MLNAEAIIRDRLASLPEFRGVYGLPELDAVETSGKPCPCVYVVYDGYRVIETSHSLNSARVQSRWMIVVAVRNYTKTNDGQDARQSAAPMVSKALSVLMGFRHSSWSKAMQLDAAPAPEFYSGLLLFPLVFTIEQVIKSTHN